MAIDVTASATLSSHQMHRVTWDLKDRAGAAAPPGKYSVLIEVTDKDAAGVLGQFEFDTSRGPAVLMPANTPQYSMLKLQLSGDWISAPPSMPIVLAAGCSNEVPSGSPADGVLFARGCIHCSWRPTASTAVRRRFFRVVGPGRVRLDPLSMPDDPPRRTSSCWLRARARHAGGRSDARRVLALRRRGLGRRSGPPRRRRLRP